MGGKGSNTVAAWLTAFWPSGWGRQQHCCWESLRDYSLVKLKLQPSQTELLFRSVDDSFLAMRTRGRSHCTTQDADPFELSVSCVGVVPSLAPAEFCTTNKGLLSVDTPW